MRDERSGERFREGYVHCVIGGDVGAQHPNACEEWAVRVSGDGQPQPIVERRSTSLSIARIRRRHLSQRLSDFYIDQMRRV